MPFRILSLDGGGAWALIQVRTLIELYGAATRGRDVLRNFDLAAANSGGSLVLAGLVEDLSLSEILQYFADEQKRRSIFSPTRSVADTVLSATLGVGPKYSAAAKLPALERLLPLHGDEPLAVQLPLAEPGAAASPLEAPRSDPSLIADFRKLAVAILDDPPDAATFIAHAVTGADAGVQPPAVSRIVRMNPLVRPVRAEEDAPWAPPAAWSTAQFRYLCDIDMDAVTQNDIAYIDDYCTFWLADRAPNQPIRMNGATFATEIGYDKFSDAKAAWQQLFPPVGQPRAVTEM
jgi:Patatin-like phospholipase